jgi:hypothetical protein
MNETVFVYTSPCFHSIADITWAATNNDEEIKKGL